MHILNLETIVGRVSTPARQVMIRSDTPSAGGLGEHQIQGAFRPTGSENGSAPTLVSVRSRAQRAMRTVCCRPTTMRRLSNPGFSTAVIPFDVCFQR